MNILIYSTLFPNPAEPTKGIFVKNRFSNFKNSVNLTIISPVKYSILRKIINLKSHSLLHVQYIPYFNIPKIFKWTDGVLLFLFTYFYVRKTLKQNKYDVIDAQWGYPDGFAVFLFSKIFNIPASVTMRGSDVNVFMQSGLRKLVMLFYLKRIQSIVVVSQSLADTLISLGINKNKIHVIRNGIDIESFTLQDKMNARSVLNLPNDRKIIICIGNLVSIKGQDLLLKAYADIVTSNMLLVIIGDGPLKSTLVQLQSKLNIHDASVLFVGKVDHSQIPIWLNASDLYVLPSRNEGMPNVIYEALACGIPVVATDVGGVKEVLNDPKLGVVVSKDNSNSISVAINDALATSWDRAYIREHAKIYSWEVTRDKCTNLWLQIKRRNSNGALQ